MDIIKYKSYLWVIYILFCVLLVNVTDNKNIRRNA